ncbi:MAG: PPC domain-containing protein, partial [Thermoflexales bacterium]|nr:PPC domain-containing protein [Thermoflexales bacterium]
INKEDNTVLESPVYGIARRYFVFLPVTRRDEAQFVGAASACAAKASPNARLTSQTVFYTPTVFFSDTWFYAENPNPNGIVQVRVRNYGGGGQVQVFYENPDCNNVLRMAPFGIAPNPVVTVSGVPTGPVYFRVVSPTVPAAPFGIAWEAFPANTTACTAWSLPPNTTLSWTARNTNDYFAITVQSGGTYRFYLQNHPVTGTQLQLRGPISGTCPNATTPLIAYSWVVNRSALLTSSIPSGGTYYIRVVTLTRQSGEAAYQIRWEPASAAYTFSSVESSESQSCMACALSPRFSSSLYLSVAGMHAPLAPSHAREGIGYALAHAELPIAGAPIQPTCNLANRTRPYRSLVMLRPSGCW